MFGAGSIPGPLDTSVGVEELLRDVNEALDISPSIDGGTEVLEEDDERRMCVGVLACGGDHEGRDD